jgi:hypothetical protein
MGGWSGSNDDESMESLELASSSAATSSTPRGPTAKGTANDCLGRLLRARPALALYCASKIPPKNLKWPARCRSRLDDSYPPDHIREFAEKSLANIGVATLDLLQFHTWHDAWADDAALADGRRIAEGERLVAPWASASIAGSRRTACGRCAPADRRRAGGLQHLRPGSEDVLFPAVGSSASR